MTAPKPAKPAAEPKPPKATPNLRDEALSALAARKQAQADEEAEQAAARVKAALTRVAKSQLDEWFPDVVWKYVGDLADGTTLVQEDGGLDVVLGITPVYNDDKHPEGQGPDSWSVAVFKPLLGGLGGQWTRAWEIGEPADLGAFLEATEPQAAPA